MSRLVPYETGEDSIAQSEVGKAAPLGAKQLEALAKYVPAEILAFYIPAAGAAKDAGSWAEPLSWISFLIGWIVVPIYIWWIAQGDRRWKLQAVVSSLAFPIWVIASNIFWPVPFVEENRAFGLWLLALFSLGSAFALPRDKGSL